MSGLRNKHATMLYSILANPHASFGSLLRFFGPCRCSSKDGKHSFTIIVDGGIYGVRVLESISVHVTS